MYSSLKKIKNVFFLLLMFVLSISLIVFPVCYATFGVKVGDWAKYEITTSVDEGSQDLLEELSDVDIDWLSMEVKTVSNESVVLELTAHFINGTEKTETSDKNELGFIVESDLEEGDSILAPYIEQDLTIDSTLSREYAGANRVVNLIEISSGEGFNTSYRSYFDQKTGILCEMSLSLKLDILGEHYESSLSYKLIETNAFGISIIDQKWFYPVLFLGLLGVGLTIVILYRHSSQKKLSNSFQKPKNQEMINIIQ